MEFLKKYWWVIIIIAIILVYFYARWYYCEKNPFGSGKLKCSFWTGKPKKPCSNCGGRNKTNN